MMVNRFIWALLFLCCFITACSESPQSGSTLSNNNSKASDSTKQLEYKSYGFSIGFPVSWKEIKLENALYVARDSCAGKYCANSILTVTTKDDKFDLNKYANAFLANIQTSATQFKVVNIKDTLIDGLNTKIIDYKMEVDGMHLGGTEALIDLPNYTISIDCTGANFPAKSYIKVRPYFMQIISSVKKI